MLFLFYFVSMKKRIYIAIIVTLFFYVKIFAQADSEPIVKNAITANREKTYNNIVNNIITKNLTLPLTDSTEESWQDAFYSLELINYRSVWVDERIKLAFASVEKRSVGFQRALLELAWAIYPTEFVPQVRSFIKQTRSLKIFSMVAEYILNIFPAADSVRFYKTRSLADEGIRRLAICTHHRHIVISS